METPTGCGTGFGGHPSETEPHYPTNRQQLNAANEHSSLEAGSPLRSPGVPEATGDICRAGSWGATSGPLTPEKINVLLFKQLSMAMLLYSN